MVPAGTEDRSCWIETHPRSAGGFDGALRCPGDETRETDGPRTGGPAGPRGKETDDATVVGRQKVR